MTTRPRPKARRGGHHGEKYQRAAYRHLGGGPPDAAHRKRPRTAA